MQKIELTSELVLVRLRQRLNEQRQGDFEVATMEALQRIEMIKHPRCLEAALILEMAANCYYAGDELSARLLMFSSGALIDQRTCEIVLRTMNVFNKG